MGRDQSDDLGKLRAIFDQGAAKFPQYLPLYRRMLNILMPRWFGSYEKVDAFIVETTSRPDITLDRETYARLYWTYASLEGDDTNIFHDASADWETMRAGFKKMIQRYPKSDFILNAFAKFACLSGDAHEYASVRPLLAKRFSATAWSDKVSIDSCDRKLMRR